MQPCESCLREAALHVQGRCINCNPDDPVEVFMCGSCTHVARMVMRMNHGTNARVLRHPITEECTVPGALFTPEGCIVPTLDEDISMQALMDTEELVPLGV